MDGFITAKPGTKKIVMLVALKEQYLVPFRLKYEAQDVIVSVLNVEVIHVAEENDADVESFDSVKDMFVDVLCMGCK